MFDWFFVLWCVDVRMLILGFSCRFGFVLGFCYLMLFLNLCCTGGCSLDGGYLEFVLRYVFYRSCVGGLTCIGFFVC